MTDYVYPVDYTGQKASNLVPGEQHAVTEANYRDYFFIVPTFAPFYARGFKLIHQAEDGTTRELKEGIDYSFVLSYLGASRSIGIPVYGAVSLTSLITSGVVSLDYQTVGGMWCANSAYVLERIAEKNYNPRTTYWDNLTNVQEVFPPVNHNIDNDYVFGQEELIASCNKIAEAVAGSTGSLPVIRHLTNFDNPHNTTAAQIGLGDVVNLPMATDSEVLQELPLNKYVTLAQVLSILKRHGIIL